MKSGLYSYLVFLTFLLSLLSCTPVDMPDECEGWIAPIGRTKLYVPPAGNQLSLSFETDSEIRYFISKGEDWLSVADCIGTDTCTVFLTVLSNTGKDRFGSLTVEIVNGCGNVEYNIFQYGVDTGELECQKNALIDLYQATDGDNWIDNTNWCTDKPLSEWYGLQFDSDGELRSLYLPYNGLKGELPSTIGDLANLDLYLLGNELYGEIPSGAFAARYLCLDNNDFTSIQEPDSPEDYPILYVSIASNSLSGSLPEALGRYPVLQTLKLTDNDYTGQIPQSYSSVYPNLQLGGNALSGRIPQSILESSYFSNYWPALLCQRGPGFDLGGLRLPLPQFPRPEDQKEINEYFSHNDYTVDVVSKERIDDAVTIVLMNSERYGGTSYLYAPSSGKYGSGWAVSYIPLCSDPVDFTFLVRYEALGHAFAKLADENSSEANGQIPSSVISDIKAKEKYGWWSNIDFTSDPSAVKWAKFIEDERYSSERVDVYKGGWGYWTGIWTPSYEAFVEYDLGATGQ